MYSLYQDPITSFTADEFWSFKNLQDLTHDVIHLRWVEDLNDGKEHLAFIVNGDKVFAKHKCTHSEVGELVDRDMFSVLINRVKAECTGKCSWILG